uniref:alpha/beta fold hydrolase n=1 Tax=Nocardia donostiensis TaxID=1538463 RepID=UPI0015938303|nr:alpha/beta hydrolase [Nocardia donostiensis]
MSTLLVVAPPAAAYSKPGTCRNHSLTVALIEGAPKEHTLAATLCLPQVWAPGEHQVDLLVAGGSYNRMYWDWPTNPAVYSYVDHTLAAGRATLSFDRLGSGASSRPAASDLTSSVGAFVIHQLVDWLHSQGYSEVNGIGHSLGSVILTDEASRWQDLDRVVLTGLLHLPGIGKDIGGLATSMYPAFLDPRFAGEITDPGFLTTIPGKRGTSFYDQRTADPEIIAADERSKDVFSIAAAVEGLPVVVAPPALNPSRTITAPVLSVIGAEDGIFCNLAVNCHSADDVRDNEAPYYPNAADFDTIVVPRTSHNLALHPSGPQTFQQIDAWIETGNVD